MRHGLLRAQFCKPPDAPAGDYWVLHSPSVIDGGSCEGFGKTEEEAIDAEMAAQQESALRRMTDNAQALGLTY